VGDVVISERTSTATYRASLRNVARNRSSFSMPLRNEPDHGGSAAGPGCTREQFLSDLVDEAEKDIRKCFAAGAANSEASPRRRPRVSWIARILAVLFTAVLVDAVVATHHGTILALGAAGIGAALSVIMIAALWARPWIAAACSFLMLTLAFAVGTLGGISNGPSLTGVPPDDAAAALLAIAVVITAIAACLAVRNTLVRAIVLVLARYSVGATVATKKASRGLDKPACAGP
jgi:hypothetical protein